MLFGTPYHLHVCPKCKEEILCKDGKCYPNGVNHQCQAKQYQMVIVEEIVFYARALILSIQERTVNLNVQVSRSIILIGLENGSTVAIIMHIGAGYKIKKKKQTHHFVTIYENYEI